MKKTEVFEQLKILQGDKSQINLINVYKGIPVSNAAQILDIKLLEMQVRTTNYQLGSMHFQKFTYLSAPSFPEIIKFDIANINISEGTAVLRNPEFSGNGIGNRTTVRVEPKNLIEGTLNKKLSERDIQGELVNISISGASFYISSRKLADEVFRIDNEIGIKFKVPVTDKLQHTEVHINGIIKNIIDLPKRLGFRIGMELFPQSDERGILTNFINGRQADLIRELSDRHDWLEMMETNR